MNRLIGMGSVLGVALFGAACGGDDTDITEFEYGTGMPGATLDEGGEMLMEKFFVSPGLAGTESGVLINTFHAYAFSGGFGGATEAPSLGTCFKFEHPTSFPVQDIPASAEYIDWGAEVTLSGPGITGDLAVPKVLPDGENPLTDNRPSPVRAHESWLYGGPTWQGDNFQDVTIQNGGTYQLDVGTQTFDMVFPPEFAFAENAGSEEVTIPLTTEGWEVTWEAKENPEGEHGYNHSFVFVAFAAFPEDGDYGPTPLYLCQPTYESDGSLIIPQDVLDDIPDAGIFQTGRLTHYMDGMDLDGDAMLDRRFDSFGIHCAVSSYTKATE